MRKGWMVCLALTAACGGIAQGSDGDGQGAIGACPDCAEPTDPSPAPGPSNPDPGQPNAVGAIAILESDIPPLDTGGGTGGASGGIDPNTLHVIIGTMGASCANPHGTFECAQWEVRLPLPPSLQQPGTIQLSAINAFFTSTTEPYSENPTDCGGGGGSFFDGTLTIHSIDGTLVVFSLQNTWSFDFDADGSYEASRCPSS